MLRMMTHFLLLLNGDVNSLSIPSGYLYPLLHNISHSYFQFPFTFPLSTFFFLICLFFSSPFFYFLPKQHRPSFSTPRPPPINTLLAVNLPTPGRLSRGSNLKIETIKVVQVSFFLISEVCRLALLNRLILWF